MTNTSIRNKTHFSCGLAVGNPKQYIKSAKGKSIDCFIVTDHCTLGGALQFYNQAKKEEFKIGIGVEFYLDCNDPVYGIPIVLIAKGQEGYTNLCRLVTLANKNDKVLTIQDLYDNYENLVCVTAEIKHDSNLSGIFSKDLFFEIAPYKDRINNNRAIFNNINSDRVVVSYDAHMPNFEDKVLQDIIVQSSTFGKTDQLIEYPKYMMDIQTCLQQFLIIDPTTPQNYIIDGIKNAERIGSLCSDVKLEFKDQIVNYPHILHPLNEDGVDKLTLLRRIIEKNNRFDLNNPVYKERLEYEIDAIVNNSRVNLIDYFLVLEDLCRYCKLNNIPVGPGRGSGAGSLVLYGLEVTHLDPIEYGLLFERFISKGRIEAGTLPDVDLDFANQEVVRQYLIGLYGEDRVKPIGTYQTLAVRGAIKDCFRIFYPDVDFKKMNYVTSLIDESIEQEDGIDFFTNQLKNNDDLQKALLPFPKVAEVVSKLVGCNRQPGIHPCGLAITQDPIADFMPIRISKDKEVLEFQADDCEASGIIKYDILGLKTLKYFQLCLKLISERYSQVEAGKGLDYPKTIYDIPLNDKRTLKAFEDADTESVFQFNSNVAKNILSKIKINNLDDLSMVTSVGRPGPMENGQHYVFIRRKNGEEEATSPHPALDELLEDTFGIMIYQESVMKCAQLMGGYSLAETDNIRKAMGKKKLEILLPYKEGFIKHSQEHFPDTKQMMPLKEGETTSISKAEYIWNLMETFSGYGFNKSHSMCYTYIGYLCQYLKVHYPLEWWSACLEYAGDPKHTKNYYRACKNRVMLPTINKSKDKYYIDYFDDGTTDEYGDEVEGFIVMPFSAVKNVASKASEAIEKTAPYTSFEDFFKRVNKRACNKRVVANLIFAGAFDCFERDKEKLLYEYYELRKEVKKIPAEYQNITEDQELEMKHSVLDFLTLDYITTYKHFLGDEVYYPEDISKLPDKKDIRIIGRVGTVKQRKTKNGDKYCVLELINNDEIYDVLAWPEEYKFYNHLIKDKEVIVVDCKVNHGWKKGQLTTKKMFSIDDVIRFGGSEI